MAPLRVSLISLISCKFNNGWRHILGSSIRHTHTHTHKLTAFEKSQICKSQMRIQTTPRPPPLGRAHSQSVCWNCRCLLVVLAIMLQISQRPTARSGKCKQSQTESSRRRVVDGRSWSYSYSYSYNLYTCVAGCCSGTLCYVLHSGFFRSNCFLFFDAFLSRSWTVL